MAFNIPPSLKGPLWMVWSCLIFVAVWGLIRYTSETVHPFVIVFWRTLFGILAFTPFLLKHGLSVLKTKHLNLHAARGVFSLFGTLGLFYAIAHIPLADAVAISYSAPVFAAAGAIVFLKEKVRWRRIAALAVGFLGVLVVLRPGFQAFTPGLFAALVGSLTLAGSLVVIKALAGEDRPQVIALYSFLFVLPPSLVIALFFWTWPTWQEFLILALIGLLVGWGHTALARAFIHAEATAVLPFDFSRMIFATIVGVLIFGERIDYIAWIGALIIVGATVYVAHREAQMERKKGITCPPPHP